MHHDNQAQKWRAIESIMKLDYFDGVDQMKSKNNRLILRGCLVGRSKEGDYVSLYLKYVDKGNKMGIGNGIDHISKSSIPEPRLIINILQSGMGNMDSFEALLQLSLKCGVRIDEHALKQAKELYIMDRLLK